MQDSGRKWDVNECNKRFGREKPPLTALRHLPFQDDRKEVDQKSCNEDFQIAAMKPNLKFLFWSQAVDNLYCPFQIHFRHCCPVRPAQWNLLLIDSIRWWICFRKKTSTWFSGFPPISPGQAQPPIEKIFCNFTTDDSGRITSVPVGLKSSLPRWIVSL